VLTIRLLGPWQVFVGDRPVAVTGRPRTVLAALALTRTGWVSIDSLIRYCWGERLPQRPRPSLQSVVVRLRKAVGTDLIRTVDDGYALDAGRVHVDLARFRELIENAEAAAAEGGRDDERASLESALALWHGEPLTGVPSELLLEEAVPRLRDEWTAAVLRRIDLDLADGRHLELTGELRALTVRHPLQEAFWLRLVATLYESGRRADAFSAYHQIRATLRNELGIDPGTDLQDCYQTMLHAETGGHEDMPVRCMPAQLPAAVPGFVGRERELDALDALLTGPASVAVVSGTAGVGKTALAVRWAHRVRERFPDGQLYVDLRGYAPHGRLGAAEALAGLLRELGVDSASVPVETAERAARFRSLLDGRRVLLVLDNAAAVEQVRPLLPGTSSCSTLITSRASLTGLVAREGAERVPLDLLTDDESLELLRTTTDRRTDADPEAARDLVSLCARLPLALRIVAERARTVREGLDAFVLDLADEQRRLDLLDAGGDPLTAVRAVFSWSFRYLDDAAALLFRLMCLHPGRDADAYALAAMVDTDPRSVHRSLDELLRAHLITESAAGRYAMHDLLRDYGAEQARSLDDPAERRSAIERLHAYYRFTAAVAVRLMVPDESFPRPHVDPIEHAAPPLPDADAARSWLDQERANLIDIASNAAMAGATRIVVDLSGLLYRYLDDGVHVDEGSTLHGLAARVAGTAGDRDGEARATHYLGVVHSRRGEPKDALLCMELAESEFENDMHPLSRLSLLSDLGQVCAWLGRYEEALDYANRALCGYDNLDDRITGESRDAGRMRVLTILGGIHTQRGDHPRALAPLFEALSLSSRLNDVRSEAMTRLTLGDAKAGVGDVGGAVEQLERAREIGEQTNSNDVQLELGTLGVLYWKLGRLTEAHAFLGRCLQLARLVGSTPTVAELLNMIGELATKEHRPHDAAGHHREALDLATKTGYRYEQFRAEAGLAAAYDHLGATEQAVEHRRSADLHRLAMGLRS
jgi:DNA-binding SARP family transcriptional activator/tetratricopeptide (TPR) repeat protein